MVADIASAQIGNAVKGALTGQIAGAMAGPGAAGGAAAAGLGAAALNGITLGAGVALTIMAYGVTKFEASEVQMEKSGERVNRSYDIIEKVKTGEITKAEASKQIRSELDAQRSDTDKIKSSNDSAKGIFGAIGGAVGSVFGALAMPAGAGAIGASGSHQKIVEGGKAGAIDVAEKVQAINMAQEKFNAASEKTLAELLQASRALTSSAENLNAATANVGPGSLSRPKAGS
jgi:hypothetical protein